MGSVSSWSVNSCRCASSTSLRRCACVSAVDQSAAARACWCVRSRTIIVNPSSPSGASGLTSISASNVVPSARTLPAAAASRGASCLGEQPGKIRPARLVKQRGRSGAHHLAALETVQACRTSAPIADVSGVVEQDHRRVVRCLVETAQRPVEASTLDASADSSSRTEPSQAPPQRLDHRSSYEGRRVRSAAPRCQTALPLTSEPPTRGEPTAPRGVWRRALRPLHRTQQSAQSRRGKARTAARRPPGPESTAGEMRPQQRLAAKACAVRRCRLVTREEVEMRSDSAVQSRPQLTCSREPTCEPVPT